MSPDPIAPLLDPSALSLPRQIVAGLPQGGDPLTAANALTALALRVWVASLQVGEDEAAAERIALDRLDSEVRTAIGDLRQLTGAAAEPEFATGA